MKGRLGILILSLGLTVSTVAQNRQQQPETNRPIDLTSITGTWKGEIKQQPAVEVLLKSDAGKLAGTAIFYPIRGVGEDAPAGEKVEVLLIDPELKGQTLAFKIKQPDGRLNKLEMRFVSQTEAIMKPSDDPDVPEEMIVKMKKAK